MVSFWQEVNTDRPDRVNKVNRLTNVLFIFKLFVVLFVLLGSLRGFIPRRFAPPLSKGDGCRTTYLPHISHHAASHAATDAYKDPQPRPPLFKGAGGMQKTTYSKNSFLLPAAVCRLIEVAATVYFAAADQVLIAARGEQLTAGLEAAFHACCKHFDQGSIVLPFCVVCHFVFVVF